MCVLAFDLVTRIKMRLKCVIVTRQVQTALIAVPLNLIEVVKVGRVRL